MLLFQVALVELFIETANLSVLILVLGWYKAREEPLGVLIERLLGGNVLRELGLEFFLQLIEFTVAPEDCEPLALCGIRIRVFQGSPFVLIRQNSLHVHLTNDVSLSAGPQRNESFWRLTIHKIFYFCWSRRRIELVRNKT